MSWASGASILSEVIVVLKKDVKDKALRAKIYKKLIGVWEDNDCDTLDECLGQDRVFDETWKKVHPDDEEDEEEEDEEEEPNEAGDEGKD